MNATIPNDHLKTSAPGGSLDRTGSARWLSCTRWPHMLGFLNNNMTTDEHGTKEQAEAVCMMLTRDGLGGEGKIYPLRTWVVAVPNH